MGNKRHNPDKLHLVNWGIAAVFLLIVIRLLSFIEPTVIGLVILEDRGNDTFEATWDFSNTGDYIFGDTIQLDNGAKLATYTEEYTLTDTDFDEGTLSNAALEDGALESAQQIIPLSLVRAYYNPDDVTSKVNEEDDNDKEIKEDKLFYILWSEALSNGDSLTLHLVSNKATDVYICDVFSSCDSSEYGESHYNGIDGYFTITLENLPDAKIPFQIHPKDDEIKLDYIAASTGQLEAAYYNPDDILDKLGTLDGNKKDVGKNKHLDLEFQDVLSNGYEISLYIADDEEATIHLCGAADFCSGPGYGSVDQNDEEGWFNITLDGMESAQKTFLLHTTEKIELDYLDANYKKYVNGYFISKPMETEGLEYATLSWDADTPSGTSIKFQLRTSSSEEELMDAVWHGPTGTEDYYTSSGTSIHPVHNGQPWVQYKSYFETEDPGKTASLNSVTITTEEDFYYDSASLQTKDYIPIELTQWTSFFYEYESNNQSISYEYSTDEGIAWDNIPENGDLSAVSTASGKIRFRISMGSDTLSTPVVAFIRLTYNVPPCEENWVEQFGSCLLNDTKLKQYSDTNACGTASLLPEDNSTFVSCDYCTLDWACGEYGACTEAGERHCGKATDKNKCFASTSLDSDTYAGNYSEFRASCIYQPAVKNETIQLISLEKDKETVLDYLNITGTRLEMHASENVDYVNMAIAEHRENPKNSSVDGKKEVGRFINIETGDTINDALEFVVLKIFYTDEELSVHHILEESLQMYYYNGTHWTPLDSWINADENFVASNLTHFSSYTILGDESGGSSSSSSGDGDGSGSLGGSGGSGRSNWRGVIPPREQTKEASVPLFVSSEPVCDYKASVELPSSLSFVDANEVMGKLVNTGNCSLDAVQLSLVEPLSDMVDLEAPSKNLAPNESLLFDMVSLTQDPGLPFLIDGFAVKVQERVVKNISGLMMISGVYGNQTVLNETREIWVNVVTTQAIADIEMTHPRILFLLIVGVKSGLFSLYLVYRFWRHHRRKKNPPGEVDGNERQDAQE